MLSSKNSDWRDERNSWPSSQPERRFVPGATLDKVTLQEACDFAARFLGEDDVKSAVYEVSAWYHEWLKTEESQNFLPSEAESFPRDAFETKREFCDWYNLKFLFSRNVGSALFDIAEIIVKFVPIESLEPDLKIVAAEIAKLPCIGDPKEL